MTLQEIQYKAQAIMQKWRDEDSAPYVEFVEELALMDVPELPEGLEEAKEAYCNEHNDDCFGVTGGRCPHIRKAFIAGTEWQKAKMMEEAVEGVARPDDCEIWVNLAGYGYKFKDGDKVKVIVIKVD